MWSSLRIWRNRDTSPLGGIRSCCHHLDIFEGGIFGHQGAHLLRPWRGDSGNATGHRGRTRTRGSAPYIPGGLPAVHRDPARDGRHCKPRPLRRQGP